jgi:hypothetical protein
MSSPIKPSDGSARPPGGPGGADGSAPAGQGGARRPDEAGHAFHGALERAGAGGAPEGAAGVGRANPVEAIVEDLRAGHIDATDAVERLVQRALEGPAAALPPARRAELEAHLRRSLRDDPTLAALTRDLSRGG